MLAHKRGKCAATPDYLHHLGTLFLKGKRDTCIWRNFSQCLSEAKMIASSILKCHLMGTLETLNNWKMYTVIIGYVYVYLLWTGWISNFNSIKISQKKYWSGWIFWTASKILLYGTHGHELGEREILLSSTRSFWWLDWARTAFSYLKQSNLTLLHNSMVCSVTLDLNYSSALKRIKDNCTLIKLIKTIWQCYSDQKSLQFSIF